MLGGNDDVLAEVIMVVLKGLGGDIKKVETNDLCDDFEHDFYLHIDYYYPLTLWRICWVLVSEAEWEHWICWILVCISSTSTSSVNFFYF